MNRSAQIAAIGRIYDIIVTGRDFRPLIDLVFDWTGGELVHLWSYDATRNLSTGLSGQKIGRRKRVHDQITTDGMARPVIEQQIVQTDASGINASTQIGSRGGHALYLDVGFGKRSPNNTQALEENFTHLAQIMQQAFALAPDTGNAAFHRHATTLMDILAVGVAIYDPNEGIVTAVNANARKVLERMGISLLSAADAGLRRPLVTKGLSAFAARVLTAGHAPVLLDCLEGEVNVIGYPLPAEDPLLEPPVALVFLPLGNIIGMQQFIARRHGLTQREQAVAAELLRGHKLPEIAQALELGHETVRSHAKAIFAKCAVHGHAQFVAKFLSGIDAFDWEAMATQKVAKVA